ncbi:hypothetical protein LTR37_018676 [Vermiconidia calcicola]|uniref:Uncharacterized protein n=1 Tax=Vermiconidia calcicola TaxID=1690605 RepID=A0ACC3MG85_9PEZI|nr:hypothetical protein LTR37_018676 [Vermiconidia calcicola]
MPGVPSGRGCEACRKQKKKFTEPSKYESESSSTPPKSQKACVKAELSKSRSPSRLCSAPSNELSVVAQSFLETIKPSTGHRYNLVWTYGGFLEYIPSRIGTNAALDASVAALTEVHSNICNGTRATTSTLAKYSKALSSLRTTLDDPVVACASETLAAVMILSICQGFLDGARDRSLSHTRGMAQIIKARGTFQDPHDPFENQLLLTVRGPVVMEALWNTDIDFTESEWQDLVSNHLQNSDAAPVGNFMSCLARVPLFIRRGMVWRTDPMLLQDVMAAFETIHLARVEWRDRFANVQQELLDGKAGTQSLLQAQFVLCRLYAFCLAISIIIGCVLGGVSPDYPGLEEDADACAIEILRLAQIATRYRPLGGSVITICLGVAWIGTHNVALRAALESSWKDYMRDLSVVGDIDSSISDLEMLEKKWRLIDICS